MFLFNFPKIFLSCLPPLDISWGCLPSHRYCRREIHKVGNTLLVMESRSLPPPSLHSCRHFNLNLWQGKRFLLWIAHTSKANGGTEQLHFNIRKEETYQGIHIKYILQVQGSCLKLRVEKFPDNTWTHRFCQKFLLHVI